MTEAPMLDPGLIAQLLPFDPFDPAFLADPYPSYAQVREKGPVTRTPLGLWAVTGHEACSAVLRDQRFGWGDGAAVADHFRHGADGSVVRPFIFADPPEHTRIRALVSKAFAARQVDRMRATAERVVHELIETARAEAGDGPIDLMRAVAHPLPGRMQNALLDVPAEHAARFDELSGDIARGLDPSFLLAPEEIAKRDSARAELYHYIGELAERRRADPGTDLISELVSVEEGGDKLTPHELEVTCTLLLSAGYATTVNLIGNGMLALLGRPEQRDWLRADPDRVPAAVEEMLRFDPPVQMISRVAVAEAEIAGHTVQPGEQVMLMIGAASHDPAVYDDPDALKLDRPAGRNLGFGLGIHFCVGAPLARLTAQAAVSALTALDLELLTETPARVPNIIMRGLAELPVRISG
ncbi:cytochrome P450 [Streptomyces pluripotens]|uniref:Cytochrome P450 n=1 Tax=Streptomyces pluripotens TaxID=1355015 RepID=A0A221P5W4_9ACTN|nr:MULTISPECIES: cytochrome P450 [Streptomyces]ASN27649.1 cytochrome P450 [Streptomyces pluripotens]MCH0561120.1 cytochrome P450 [Streptomyces sp. MUM 16J]